jgi:Zn-dependent M28 family amino/carboxypeptidase
VPLLCRSSRLSAVVAVVTAAVAVSAADIRIDRGALLEDLRVLSSDEMQGRAAGTDGGLRARRYIVERFRAIGLDAPPGGYEQTFPLPQTARGARAATGANVLGLVRGTTRPDRFIVVSAHYDHEGVRGGRVFNGANDNASGTAALFATARHFLAQRPATSIVIAAFDAEEDNLRGSRHFVRSPPIERGGIILNINADMIGRSTDNILYVVGAHAQPGLRPLVERVSRAAPVILKMDYDGSTAREDWTDESDQYSFIEAGIPALYIGVEDFEQHHRPTDDYETMSHDFFVRAVETMIHLVAAADEDAERIQRLRR